MKLALLEIVVVFYKYMFIGFPSLLLKQGLYPCGLDGFGALQAHGEVLNIIWDVAHVSTWKVEKGPFQKKEDSLPTIIFQDMFLFPVSKPVVIIVAWPLFIPTAEPESMPLQCRDDSRNKALMSI